MYKQALYNLTKRLLPKGRAFKAPLVLDRVYKGLNESENRAYSDALSILDSILPDNDNFTEEDAEDWERRLGLITNPNVPLEDRKLAILRKYNHPGGAPARQHYTYIESQLQLAGFDVNVVENRTPVGGGVYDLLYIPNLTTVGFEMGDGNDMGTAVEMGGRVISEYEICANHIDSALDEGFFDPVPDPATFELILRSSFFICDTNYNNTVDVSLERKEEFRQLILRLKPAQSFGLLNVNYV